ncbi:MAG: GspH/FimT family pseudopilin [Betaproteobacteria bacterium]|nr:GspH/FimT family pseudopilin [Betaproteobacteria bacterium]MBI2960096.1 GspH/FimT family pseudopilin [Betaproteobacteria bacterium]
MIEKERGFTLLEMLVVVMIMGLFIGLVATIAQPDERGLLRIEAERLAQLLDLCAEEARLTARPIAWTSDGPGYRFWRFAEPSGWSEIRDNDTLRARVLPQGMAILGLRVENMRPRGGMRLEFTPHGEMLSFSIEMSLGAERYDVAGSPMGEVRVVRSGASANEGMAPG